MTPLPAPTPPDPIPVLIGHAGFAVLAVAPSLTTGAGIHNPELTSQQTVLLGALTAPSQLSPRVSRAGGITTFVGSMKSATQVAAGFGAIGSEEAAAELFFGPVYSSRCRFSSCG